MRTHTKRSIKRRRNIMTRKYMVAVALIAPLLIAPAMAQDGLRIDQHVYQGGPKSGIPHSARQVTVVRESFAMVPKVKMSHHYSGGPQTVVPHHSD
jgi:hypothetical protein